MDKQRLPWFCQINIDRNRNELRRPGQVLPVGLFRCEVVIIRLILAGQVHAVKILN